MSTTVAEEKVRARWLPRWSQARRQPLTVAGATIALVWLLVAVFAPLVAPYDPLEQSFTPFASPSADHLFGTDELGRDVFSRVVYGARISLPLGLLLVVLASTIGGVLGSLAGYFRGWVDGAVMRTADLVFAFPAIILAMVVTAALGRGLTNAVLALVIVAWPSYARVVRSLVLSVGESEYVWATRLLGASSRRALVRDVLPNVVGPVLVLATLDVGNAILLLSGLSFLGLGAQPPAAEWGSMVATGTQYFQFWWMGTFPGLAIFTAVLAFNFIGDSLRDVFDPTNRARVEGAAVSALLEVEDLRVRLPVPSGHVTVVDGIDYRVEPGEVFGIAGESGSGKTMSVLALMGLLPPGGTVGGSAVFAGRDLLRLPQRDLRRICGRELAMVFQDPMTSLHPMLSVGTQLTEHVRRHLGLGRRDATGRALELLREVRIPDPNSALSAFPHQFSGGMRQRIAIAVALACRPTLLVADEPTTALDVTVQAGIIRLLDRLRRETGLSIVLISHDLGVLSAIADRVAVFYAGRIVEGGGRADVLSRPRHPYTRGLLDALPHPEAAAASALVAIPGTPPAGGRVPPGCAFHPRCRYALESCRESVPPLVPVNGRTLACPVDPLRG